MPSDSLPAARPRPILVRRLLAGLVIALLAGVATSFLQTVLPDAFASAANSAGTWCLIAFAVMLWCAPSRLAVLVGPASLALLVAGYYTTAAARGFGVSPTSVGLWLAASVVIGLVIGLSAVWLSRQEVHGDSVRRAIAVAPMPGILIGEGLHGVLRLTETTSVVYWGVEIAIGVVLAGWLVVRRITSVRARLIAVAATVAVATVILGVYGG